MYDTYIFNQKFDSIRISMREGTLPWAIFRYDKKNMIKM